MLPGRIAADGMLSDAQLESVILAGQAHGRRLDALYRIAHDWETVERADNGNDDNRDDESTDADADPGVNAQHDDGTEDVGEALSGPVRFRRGWMLGDGTGCGKGRQVAAVILDNRAQGPHAVAVVVAIGQAAGRRAPRLGGARRQRGRRDPPGQVPPGRRDPP